jgi:hypothetical protein
MCGKFTAMVSWGDIVEYGSMFTRPSEGEGSGSNDERDTFRVNGLLPVIVWDAEVPVLRAKQPRPIFPAIVENV